MTDGTFQPDAKSQELLTAGVAPSAVETFQADRAVTAAKAEADAQRAAGYRDATPEEIEDAKNGYVSAPAEPFRAVLTPEQRQNAAGIMAERNAAQRAAKSEANPPGWADGDPLDVYTDEELLAQQDFNPEDHFRRNQVAIESNPAKFARFTELYRKSKQRGMSLGALGKGALKTAGEILASPYGLLTYASKAAAGEAGPATAGESIPRMLTNLGRTVVTGLNAGPGAVVGDIAGSLVDETYRGASEASQRPAAEALAGTVADAAGFVSGVQGAGEKALRLVHIAKPWEKMTPDEVREHLRAKAANKQALEELGRGEVSALKPTIDELAAKGTPLRPEEVARHAEGGPVSWLGYGKIFEGIHAGAAGAKKWVNNTAAGKLAGEAEVARQGFAGAAKEAQTFATAENAAKLRAAERELASAEAAVKASPTAQALDALAKAKAGLGKLTQAAAAGTVEKVGQALQLPEKLLHKLPGVSTFGTIAGMFSGGIKGAATALAARAGAAAAAKAGQAVEAAGKAAAPGVSRSVAMSRAADLAQAFNDSVGKALGPGGLGMDVAFSAALTPEGEQPEEVGAFMGTMRLFKGLPVAGRRVLGGELVRQRPLTREVAVDPAYGANPVLDAAHTAGMRLANQEGQDRVNFVRALGRKLGGQIYLIDPAQAVETLVEAYRQKGVTITPEQAADMARGDGIFKMDLPDADGNMQRVVFAFRPESVHHEAGHLLQSVLPESVNLSIDTVIGKDYNKAEFDAFAEDYTRRLLRNADGSRLTPEQVANDRWRALLAPSVPKELKTVFPQDPTGVEAYIVRELGAENLSKSFGSTAENIGEKPDIYRRLAFGIAGVAQSLGVNLLGETTLGAAVKPRVMKEQEIALADITKSPERQAVIDVEARRAQVQPPAPPRAPTPQQERQINRAVEQASDAAPPVDAVVPLAEAQNARQITEIIADVIRRGGGMLKAWYRTAPGATDAELSSMTPVSEAAPRAAAIEAARVMPESERPLWERLFFAESIAPSSRGPQVLSWNPMTFAANAVRWAKALQAAGSVAESPYPIVNGELTPDGWRQLRNDLQVASRNILAGYAGSGAELGKTMPAAGFREMVEKAGYTVPEKTTVSPEQIPQGNADVVAYLMGHDTIPATARMSRGTKLPLNVMGQLASEATIPGRTSAIPGAPVYEGPLAEAKGIPGVSVKDVNPFRAKMRALGVAPELFSVRQRLNVEHLAKVEPAPEQPIIASNTFTAAAGFMPKAGDRIGGQFTPSDRKDVPNVRAAAMRDKTTGKIFTGFFHAMAWDRIFDELGPIDGVKGLADYEHPNFQKVMDRFERGFAATDPGKEGFRFVTPDEAKAIGEKNGQLEAKDRGEAGVQSEELFGYGEKALGEDAIRPAEKPTAEEPFAIEPPKEVKAQLFEDKKGQAMPATSSFGRRLEEEGFEFRTTGNLGVRTVEVWKDGEQVGELQSAQNKNATTAYVGNIKTVKQTSKGEGMRRRGLAEAMYRELANQLQDDGVTEIEGMAVHPSIPRLRERVFGNSQIETGEGTGISPEEASAYIKEKLESPTKEAFYAEIKNAIRPKSEGQYSATSEKGKELEKEGFEFTAAKRGRDRFVRVTQDGDPVGEIIVTVSDTDKRRAKVAAVDVEEPFREQGLGEALYREAANTLQDEGVTNLTGFVVAAEPLSIRERVFGDTGIRSPEGEGMTVPEAQDMLRRERAGMAFVDAENFIRPKSEGQYSPPEEKKEHNELFSGYKVGKGGYSQGETMLRDNILDAMSSWQAKGTVEQLQKHLGKFSGTKDQARWIGLDRWLDAKKAAGESVTKGEVEDFVSKKQIQFEELTLTEGERPDWSEGENETDEGLTLPYWDFYRGDIGESYGSVHAEATNAREIEEAVEEGNDPPEPDIVYKAFSATGRYLGKFQTPEMAQREVEDRYSPEGGEGEAQYAKWTLPGGYDYREILVRLPSFPESQEFTDALEVKEKFRAEMVAKYGTFEEFRLKRTPTEAKTWDEFRDATRTEEYEAPHFDDNDNNKNLIAHMRVKSRKTLDGQELFFLEEIQSDLHQEGAKSGYQSEVMGIKDRDKLMEQEVILRRRAGQYGEEAQRLLTPEELGEFKDVTPEEASQLAEETSARRLTESRAAGEAMLDAPLKGAGWKKLLMKRAIIAAAEEGKDALGWTTGEMQRERYNLAKHIGGVTYSKDAKGTYSVQFWRKGSEVDSPSGGALAHELLDVPLSKVAELAGNDLAKQIEAGEGSEKPYRSTGDFLKRGKAVEVFSEPNQNPEAVSWKVRYEDGTSQGGWVSKEDAQTHLEKNNEILAERIANPRRMLSPEDLSLGGKGKLNLYDREMVNIANDIGKKYGAKVEMKLVKVPGADAQGVWVLPVTDALRKQVKSIGLGQYSPKAEESKPNKLGFFSAARRALEAKMPNRASAAQVRAVLSPANGVKAEELKWSGLDERISDAEKAGRPFDKSELLNFLDTNNVIVQEQWRARRPVQQAGVLPPGVYREKSSRWDRYKQPGGRYYRELIWHWGNPKGRADRAPFTHRQHWGSLRNPLAHARMTDRFEGKKKVLFIEELQSDLHQKGRNRGYWSAEDNAKQREVQREVNEQSSRLGNISRELDTKSRGLVADAVGGWDKYRELTNEADFKELASEESRLKSVYEAFQADTEGQKAEDIDAKRKDWDEARQKRFDYFRNHVESTLESEKQPEALAMIDRAEKMSAREPAATRRSTLGYMAASEASKKAQSLEGRPPEAPFSKSWREVFFRRLVNYAARMGYDKVGWTTGSQQANLYATGIRQAVDSISWKPAPKFRLTDAEGKDVPESRNHPSNFVVTATKGGLTVFEHTFERDGTPVTPLSAGEAGDGLAEVVGDGLASKIKKEAAAGKPGELQGEALAIGAKWMQEVYDVILPDYARKFGKKFGAKVEMTPIGRSEYSVPKKASRIPREHPGLFEPTDIVEPKSKVNRKPDFTAWTMDITPAMRKSVSESGTAQFSPKTKEGEGYKLTTVKTAWGDFPDAVMHTSIAALKAHPDYEAAKAGDPKAAVRVTRTVVKPDRAAALAENFPDAKLLPVRAEERRGRNALPSALAVTLSDLTGLDLAPSIVQASRAYHTGATDAERVARRATFAGPVEEGGKYILVDDVSTSGSTLAALRAFIRKNGGEVVGVTVLGAAHRPDRGHGSHVALRPETLDELKGLDKARIDGILQRYELENLDDLSNGEARIILREARKTE